MPLRQDLPPPRTRPSVSDPEADRLARLALNHAVEPADQQIGRLLQLHSPIEVLAAIRRDQLPDLDPDPARRDRLADRCTGLRLRLEPARIEAGIAAADAVFAGFITPGDRDWPVLLDDLGPLRPIGIWAIGAWPGARPAAVDPSGDLDRNADQTSEDSVSSDSVSSDSAPSQSPPPRPTPVPARTASPAAETVSIVGARACTGYGSHIAATLGADLASAGVTVVSGAALGIDAAAHRGALAVGGPTVAVLACGIDRIYPRAHEALLRVIAERGAVLSELPPGAAPTRFRFLHRNRIIAALGVGTVIVEAARRSGSLVTARLAGELGRVVMAVPGPVTSDRSAGTHDLIRDGATLVAQAAQVREACASLAAASYEPRAAQAPTTERSPAARVRDERPGRRPRPASLAEPADPVEELVLEALPRATADAGAEVFALARATGLGPDAVFAALGRLAAAGRAVRQAGGWMLSTRA